jgi:hypothetical protein
VTSIRLATRAGFSATRCWVTAPRSEQPITCRGRCSPRASAVARAPLASLANCRSQSSRLRPMPCGSRSRIGPARDRPRRGRGSGAPVRRLRCPDRREDRSPFGTHRSGQAQCQCFGQEARPWERWIADPGVSVRIGRGLPRGPVQPKHSKGVATHHANSHESEAPPP